MFPTADTEDISQVTSLEEKLSSTSDVRNVSEDTPASTQQTNRELTLNMLIKEIVFCIALAVTTYGALHNTPTKISKHPKAERFFSENSGVKDWYEGQLSHALTSLNSADVSFVMYYAPWDAESQYVRGEFEKASLLLGDRINFIAINCWNPGSECRLHHNKIASWPILMAYTVNSKGVHYKGPRDAHSLVNFLELIMKPLKRISSMEDLVNLLSYCDAVAVGYTPLHETSKYYNIWYQVSLKSREYDVVGEICFAVVISEDLAVDLGVEILPNARLMLWNETKEYISDENNKNLWNESSLMMWVLENFSQPVARITPMWKKSFTFERYIDGNPLLLLFTPLNPLYEQIPNYSLMREIAMEYYNCKNNESNQWTTELIKLQRIHRLIYQQKDYLKFCQEYKVRKPVRKHNVYRKEFESQNNKYPWNNSTQRPNKSGFFNFFIKRGLGIVRDGESMDEASLLTMDWLEECSPKSLPAERNVYDNLEQCRMFEHNLNFVSDGIDSNVDVETTMLPSADDPLSPENLLQDNIQHICKLTKFAQEFSPQINPVKVENNITEITGLACAHNFTLNMIAMDSVHNHHFAESLGIDILNKKDMTAVVILDTKQESQYVMKEEYNAKTVRDFIYNFTNRSLKRTLRTHVEDAAHTHYFGSDGITQQMELNNDTVHIMDLTTKSFRRLIKTPGPLALVLICSGGCGAAWSAAAGGAARLVARGAVRAAAARLDARAHDLPWPYAPHRCPTLYVFSPDRSTEAVYPSGQRVSAAGAVALALRTLAQPLHLRVRITLCQHTQSNAEKKTCLRDIREQVTKLIDRNLKYWRRTENRELKDALYKRLQHLHQVSLELSILHVTDLLDNNNKLISLLESLNSLNKHWNKDQNLFNINKNRSKKLS